MTEPHTALFVAPTGVGKTYLALNLLETEYRNHFNFIVIICPTLRYNSTYKNRSWVWNDPDVIPIELGNNLYYLIEKISNLLTGDKTLFLTDDIIADETLDKCHQPLLELTISGRHRGHSLWLLTQSYTAIPNNIRRQAKMLYVWYPKNRMDLNTVDEENDVIGLEELARVKDFNTLQTLHLETLNELTGVDSRMEAENRSLVEKSLMEEINELKKKAETKA